MPDPVIKIVIEDQPVSGQGPPAPPGKPDQDQTSPKPKDKNKPDGEDQPLDFGAMLRSFLGRRIPGGQKTLDMLGLGDLIDDIGKKFGPAVQAFREKFNDLLRDFLGIDRAAKPAAAAPPASPPTPPAPNPAAPPASPPTPGGRPGRTYASGTPTPPASPPSPPAPKPTAPPTPTPSSPPGGRPGRTYSSGTPTPAAPAVRPAPPAPTPSPTPTPTPAPPVPAAGGGAAAGGMAGSLAAIAGPLAIAYLASEAIGKLADAASGAVTAVGHFGAQIVLNNPGPALRAISRGSLEFIDESVPILGKVLTAIPKVFLAVADAAQELTNAFVSRARELAGYSASISAAQAEVEVSHVMADLREVERMGPKYAQIVAQQGKLDVGIQDAMLPVKEILADILLKIYPLLQDGVSAIKGMTNAAKIGYDAFGKTVEITANASPFVGLLYNSLMSFLNKGDRDETVPGDWKKLVEAFLNWGDRPDFPDNPFPPGGPAI